MEIPYPYTYLILASCRLILFLRVGNDCLFNFKHYTSDHSFFSNVELEVAHLSTLLMALLDANLRGLGLQLLKYKIIT